MAQPNGQRKSAATMGSYPHPGSPPPFSGGYAPSTIYSVKVTD
ncbi:unnamed protein product [Oikopleura dioica]|uniref:Uncharacterized protein n=1 Tax=Oikopleura dioica TaxID=34765 RepID=E4WTN7_OIKDI|nr:unnamed protein product [Oikopleura dioica]